MPEQEIFIFEVSEASFGTSVILNSHRLPVVVEFMGMWSEPCIRLEDALAARAREFAGQFVFAKVDIDEQQALAKEYGIENVPTLKVFKDGEVVRTEEGLLNDDEVSDLLRSYGIFRASDELRMQARQKHLNGDTVGAITLLTRAIKEDPANTRVAMDMVQVMLDVDELDAARGLYGRLPESDRDSTSGRALAGQLTFKTLAAETDGPEQLARRLAADPDDHDARFDLAVCLVAERDYREAMNNLFTIFDREPEYRNGAAREMIINLTNMLAPNDPATAQEFRRRLGSTLS